MPLRNLWARHPEITGGSVHHVQAVSFRALMLFNLPVPELVTGALAAQVGGSAGRLRGLGLADPYPWRQPRHRGPRPCRSCMGGCQPVTPGMYLAETSGDRNGAASAGSHSSR